MNARPAYVEEVDENDQILPGTRRTARTLTKMQSPDKNGEKPLEPGKEDPQQNEVKNTDATNPDDIKVGSSQKNTVPDNIPESYVLPAAGGAEYYPYYYRNPPLYEASQQYFFPYYDDYGMMVNEYSSAPDDFFSVSKGNYGPPPLVGPMSAYYQHPQIPPVLLSYPPPSYETFPSLPPQDYFNQPSQVASRSLASRFQTREQPLDPIARASSAFGTRDFPRRRATTLNDDGRDSFIERNFYRNRVQERRIDVQRSAPLTRESYRHDVIPSNLMPQERLPREPPYREPLSSGSNTQAGSRARGPNVSFDLSHKNERLRFEPTVNSSRPRHSWYERPMPESSVDLQSKLKMASSYMHEAVGHDIKSLKRLQKRPESSSRTTKSNGSRDGSDIRKSDLHTMRSISPSEDQNVTIKVLTGSARVTLGDAQIDCSEGGAIEIKRDKISRDSSKRSSPEFITARPAIEDRDRRTRNEKHHGRLRINSRARRQSLT